MVQMVQGSSPGGGREFPHLSIPALGHMQLPVQWVPGLSQPHVGPSLRRDQSYISIPTLGLFAPF